MRVKKIPNKRALEDHPLYQSNKKPQLEVICWQLKIQTLPKFQLLKLIIAKKKEQTPPEPKLIKYNGNLSTIPVSMAAIAYLTLFQKLTSILKYHHISQFGMKDQLVIRVHLLRHDRSDAAIARGTIN